MLKENVAAWQLVPTQSNIDQMHLSNICIRSLQQVAAGCRLQQAAVLQRCNWSWRYLKVGQEHDWGLASLIPRVGGAELGTGQHTLVAKCSQHQLSAGGHILEVTTCSSHLRVLYNVICHLRMSNERRRYGGDGSRGNNNVGHIIQPASCRHKPNILHEFRQPTASF